MYGMILRTFMDNIKQSLPRPGALLRKPSAELVETLEKTNGHPAPPTVCFQLTHAQARLPRRAHPDDAGMDLSACERVVLQPRARALVRTGLRMEMPRGFEAQLRPRSGLALEYGVTLLNTPGTIDAGYRGEIGVILINHGTEPVTIEPGMRIAQMVFARVEAVGVQQARELGESRRGAGGFGSSGLR